MITTNINTLKELITKANKVMDSGKKLTPKDRKKLPDSVYCGPNRSFPCNDCKHVAVARAYLGKSKFSDATKKKIAACINKKAKKLGCDTPKKDKSSIKFPIYIELSYEQKQLYMADDFKSTRALVEQSLLKPDMDLNAIDIAI